MTAGCCVILTAAIADGMVRSGQAILQVSCLSDTGVYRLLDGMVRRSLFGGMADFFQGAVIKS